MKKLSQVVQVVSPHPLPKRVPVRGAVFLLFNVDIPPALPSIRGRAAASGYFPHASLPRARRWGATRKSHLPDEGDPFACFPIFFVPFVSFVAEIPPASLPHSSRNLSSRRASVFHDWMGDLKVGSGEKRCPGRGMAGRAMAWYDLA